MSSNFLNQNSLFYTAPYLTDSSYQLIQSCTVNFQNILFPYLGYQRPSGFSRCQCQAVSFHIFCNILSLALLSKPEKQTAYADKHDLQTYKWEGHEPKLKISCIAIHCIPCLSLSVGSRSIFDICKYVT